jgi:hypothetical protein
VLVIGTAGRLVVWLEVLLAADSVPSTVASKVGELEISKAAYSVFQLVARKGALLAAKLVPVQVGASVGG